MSRIHAPHVEGRFGTDASDTLLSATVYLGMFENRQMNASKLADYVGAPRSTMDLEELERVGRVERRARQGIEPVPPPCQGSPRHQFSCEIKTKRPVEVVNRVTLAVRRPLPLFPDQRTFSESVGTSQRCTFV
jgi:hypothetical protein